jgi:hypothetical protein
MTSPVSPNEGRLAIVTNVRWDAVDADAPLTNGADAYGEDVWFWRPDAGVKFCGKAREATVARKPVTEESTL